MTGSPGAGLRFSQVDVFSDRPHAGNPVAVVHAADGLSDEQMAAFARWTNLSETTYLLEPTLPGTDYRLRIFTGRGELPFAGHPTLGSAHAWLEAGGRPASDEHLVQECAAGLVRVRRSERLAFAAPPLVRSGPVAPGDVARVVAALRLDPGRLLDAAWVDNGPGWMGLLLDGAGTVLGLEPDGSALAGLKVGVVGVHAEGERAAVGAHVEVRAFFDRFEDPVTGSLNAGLAQWLVAAGRLPTSYVAAQGTGMGRLGRVHVETVPADGSTGASTTWVGGSTTTAIEGRVAFGPR
ncbi:PhzF family phenazine biosynthesis protein [Nocardioides solisilvae]|uniref:PhzF family phenazine biosynthesis protein n=1 Tax=Nocardioides solisilvae TaxID=1542435 RepID=UPI000D74248B|nr:PhzF family phenazine biosynthesis protein [Nocardioides solisilvae]